MEGKEEGTVDQKRGETRTKRTAKKLKNKDKARRIEIVTLGGRAVLRRGTWRNQVKTERPREDDQSGHGKGNETEVTEVGVVSMNLNPSCGQI